MIEDVLLIPEGIFIVSNGDHLLNVPCLHFLLISIKSILGYSVSVCSAYCIVHSIQFTEQPICTALMYSFHFKLK